MEVKNGSTQKTLPEIIANFRARNVTFTLKDGSKKTIFVEEIENEDDDQPELIFMAGGDNLQDIWISDVVSAEPELYKYIAFDQDEIKIS